MDNYNDIKLAIFEAYEDNEITESEKDDLLYTLESTAAEKHVKKVSHEAKLKIDENNKKIKELQKQLEDLDKLENERKDLKELTDKKNSATRDAKPTLTRVSSDETFFSLNPEKRKSLLMRSAKKVKNAKNIKEELKNKFKKESVEELKLSIFEAYENNEITESEKDDLLYTLENTALDRYYDRIADKKVKIQKEILKLQKENEELEYIQNSGWKNNGRVLGRAILSETREDKADRKNMAKTKENAESAKRKTDEAKKNMDIDSKDLGAKILRYKEDYSDKKKRVSMKELKDRLADAKNIEKAKDDLKSSTHSYIHAKKQQAEAEQQVNDTREKLENKKKHSLSDNK